MLTPRFSLHCRPARRAVLELAALAVVFMLTAPLLCAAAAQSAADYTIGPADVLTIQVFDQPDLGGKYTVEADGTFSFPMIGRVKAGGVSLRAFETALKGKLVADGIFRNPQVTVAVEQYRSQRVFVMGEVRSPGP
ncbi:MAG: polysaccharide biosynthesis/export family protein, partial [Acidobacteriota bacterium]